MIRKRDALPDYYFPAAVDIDALGGGLACEAGAAEGVPCGGGALHRRAFGLQRADGGGLTVVEMHLDADTSAGVAGHEVVEGEIAPERLDSHGAGGVIQRIAGAQIVYPGSEPGVEAKNLIQIGKGDRIQFICDFYDYNGNYDERTIRKKFLDQNVGKQFYINTDPDKTTDTNVKQAVLWLQGQGYTFKKNALGYWEAVKEY